MLGTCPKCGFSFNTEFDSAAIVYDERYDNSVPSATFRNHCQSVVEMLLNRVDGSGGAIYDVGCGKGEFLEMFCASAPAMRGIGIDPSCQPTERANFRLIQSNLEPGLIASDARLVVLRHVLEHIADPVAFLAMIRACMPDVPLYVEVPDLRWILKTHAFWDFCYEHCNYFEAETLATCVRAAGFAVIDQAYSFDDQYQWVICRPAKLEEPPQAGGAQAVAATTAYAHAEAEAIVQLQDLANDGGLAVWGMATKGVILSTILGADCVLGGIDINPGKQGCFAPVSGVAIHPPEWICSLQPDTTVLVMNPNYLPEIAAQVESLGAQVRLVPV